MFHFRFDLEEEVDSSVFPRDDHQGQDVLSVPQKMGEPFSELDLNSLLAALPAKISYSFVSVPDGKALGLKLARRDLFDARFQLISQGTTDAADDSESADQALGCDPSLASSLAFIDNPSDLVPLVYEGGLKTWECSLDLATYLKHDGHATRARGRRVLELGCGTAIPALCVLQEIFASPLIGDAETHVHLQDYNASVLHLVTAPNVVLTWYTSPAASTYRNSEAHTSQCEDNVNGSELHITPELLHAFKTSLCDYRLRLRFFAGAWDTFDLQRTGGPYHLVLTSETIYHPSSLASLVRVLHDACAGGHAYLCLVAAKTVYFGVGGGIAEFVRCVGSIVDPQSPAGRVETVWEKVTGVSRQVMRLHWS